jgi:hypothetical protein
VIGDPPVNVSPKRHLAAVIAGHEKVIEAIRAHAEERALARQAAREANHGAVPQPPSVGPDV